MKHHFVAFAAIASASLASGVLAQGATKIDLKVLYAGDPSHERTGDFMALLESNFAAAKSVSYETFKPEQADGFDVVIFDWPSIYPRDESGAIQRENFTLKTPDSPRLPMDWDRPTIVIGGSGERIAADLRSKIDWL